MAVPAELTQLVRSKPLLHDTLARVASKQSTVVVSSKLTFQGLFRLRVADIDAFLDLFDPKRRIRIAGLCALLRLFLIHQAQVVRDVFGHDVAEFQGGVLQCAQHGFAIVRRQRFVHLIDSLNS